MIEQFKKQLLIELHSKPVETAPIIRQLRQVTAVGGLIDPDREPEQFASWLEIINELWRANRIYQAIEIASAWYERICELQELNQKRYHKGGVTHVLGNSYLSYGEVARAVWFYTLAFIEDALSNRHPESNPTPATDTLNTRFSWGDSHFQTIASRVEETSKEQPDLCRYPELIAVQLARQQNLLLPPAKLSESIPVNRPFLKLLISKLDTGTADQKKKSLEFLASYLAITLPNVKLMPNARTPDYEMDLVVIQTGAIPTYILEALGRFFLIECKNLKESVSVEQLNHFVAKMRFHRCHCGVIFSPEGLSGNKQLGKGMSYARLTQLRWYHQEQCVVIVVTKSDLNELISGTRVFGDLLLRGYEMIRFSTAEIPVVDGTLPFNG